MQTTLRDISHLMSSEDSQYRVMAVTDDRGIELDYIIMDRNSQTVLSMDGCSPCRCHYLCQAEGTLLAYRRREIGVAWISSELEVSLN